MDDNVTYLPVPGFQGYLVGDDGSLWGSRGNKSGRYRRLYPAKTSNGYRCIKLCDGKGRHWMYFHEVVLLAFVGPRPSGKQACHYDNDRSHNRPDNLRWDTPTGNHKDKQRHGTGSSGTRNPRAKVNPNIVRRILAASASGMKVKAIAEAFSLSYFTTYDIVTRKTWREVTVPPELGASK